MKNIFGKILLFVFCFRVFSNYKSKNHYKITHKTSTNHKMEPETQAPPPVSTQAPPAKQHPNLRTNSKGAAKKTKKSTVVDPATAFVNNLALKKRLMEKYSSMAENNPARNIYLQGIQTIQQFLDKCYNENQTNFKPSMKNLYLLSACGSNYFLSQSQIDRSLGFVSKEMLKFIEGLGL